MDLHNSTKLIQVVKKSFQIDDYIWCPNEARLPNGMLSNKIPEGAVPFNFSQRSGLCYEADVVRTCTRNGNYIMKSSLFLLLYLIKRIHTE